jgi:hypothetical protein
MELQQKKGRGLERVFVGLISIILGLLFLDLYSVLERDFQGVPKRMSEGSIVNLNDKNPDQRIKYLLQKGYYFEDPRDIELIRSVVGQRINTDEKIDNIGELNKSKYNVDAEQAFIQGGESYKKRVLAARALLGYTGADSNRFFQERKAPPPLPAVNALDLGKYRIGSIVRNANDEPVAGVLVRLEMILPQDSVYSDEVSEVERQQIESGPAMRKIYAVDSLKRKQLVGLTAFARTDVNGKVEFTGLPPNRAFEVLPLQPGSQFGRAKGVQELDKNKSFEFYQTPHKIRLLSSRDFNILKKERSLIVRTPEEASKWYWIITGSFFLCFFVLHIFLSLRFQRADQLIVPVVMLLTGLSLITLLSLQDPLRDRYFVWDAS